MNIKIKFSALFLTVFLGLILFRTALTSTGLLSGKITTTSADGISGAIVDVTDPNTNNLVASTTSDSSGNYSVSLSGGIYNIRVTPPTASNFTPVIAQDYSISTDTVLNFILVAQGTSLLSGHVYDSFGNPAPGQTVIVYVPGSPNVGLTNTDAFGGYSLQVPPGVYSIAISSPGSSNDLSSNLSQFYNVTIDNYSLNISRILDVTLPFKRVVVHVQNVSGNPVSGISVKASGYNDRQLSLGGGITNARGSSLYQTQTYPPTLAPVTDLSGDVILWLLPNSSNQSYTFTAIPPSGSIYNSFTLNLPITSDETEIISLQFIHDRPITTASLSPTPDLAGNYFDPTTVTLSAVAAPGFSIAATYYTIDGGPTQNYSVPLVVIGNGNHALTYWSVDSIGVPELPNTLNFTIAASPTITTTTLLDAIAGVAYSQTIQAIDGTLPYVWAISAGSLPSGLSLVSSTGEISGIPITAGVFMFTVQAIDANNRTAMKDFFITVHQTLNALSPASVWIGLKNSDDIGTKFDLLAEVLKNNMVIGSGELGGVNGGSSGFNNAVNRSVALALSDTPIIASGDILSFRLSVRISTTVPGHTSGTARLWFNDSQANSHFDATIGTDNQSYYLLDNSTLATASGLGPKKTIDVFVNKNAGGNPFKSFGTWNFVMP